jgi:hypothetical protein
LTPAGILALHPILDLQTGTSTFNTRVFEDLQARTRARK